MEKPEIGSKWVGKAGHIATATFVTKDNCVILEFEDEDSWMFELSDFYSEYIPYTKPTELKDSWVNVFHNKLGRLCCSSDYEDKREAERAIDIYASEEFVYKATINLKDVVEGLKK